MSMRKIILGGLVFGLLVGCGQNQTSKTNEKKPLNISADEMAIKDINFDPKNYTDPKARAIAQALADGPKVYNAVLVLTPMNPKEHQTLDVSNPDIVWTLDFAPNATYAEPSKLKIGFKVFATLESLGVFELLVLAPTPKLKLKIKDPTVGKQTHISKNGITQLRIEYPILQVTGFDQLSITSEHLETRALGYNCKNPVGVNISVLAVSELGNKILNTSQQSGLQMHVCLSNNVEPMKVIEVLYIGEPPIIEGR